MKGYEIIQVIRDYGEDKGILIAGADEDYDCYFEAFTKAHIIEDYEGNSLLKGFKGDGE